MSESLYFIAVVPPEEIQHEITKLKMEVAERFGSKHALNAPAHITLHMPFRWKDSKREILIELMQEVNQDIKPFLLKLDGFGFFEPRVVYVDVEENEHLTELQRKVQLACRMRLKKVNANYRDQVFHPHMTIGFRDLKKTSFYEAKAHFELEKYKTSFPVEGVSILKHDGKIWHGWI